MMAAMDSDANRPLRCSANVSMLFPGMPLLDALETAAHAGFHTLELIDPYQLQPATLVRALRDRDLTVDLLNLPMGDFAAGERGLAGDPDRRAEFRAGLDVAQEVIELVRPRKVNVLAGRSVPGHARQVSIDCLVDNLAFAADQLRPTGVRVVTEMINPWDVPGFLVSSVPVAQEVLAALEGRVWLQLDIYHLQRIQGELLRTIAALAPLTGHIQIADAPDRSEPGTGEINIRNVLAGIAATGYDDFIGLEYRPSPGCVDPFAWVEEYGLVRA
jgi:hydroxypyruvate isomerase